MENKINIQDPCNENWNSMSPNKKGRFCNSCNKTVVDFTKMENTEIQKYFIENSNHESICGYYKFNQVESEKNTRYTYLRNRFNRIKIKPIKILALFSLSLAFTFSSCIMGKRAEQISEEELIENDANNKKEINNPTENIEQKDYIREFEMEINNGGFNQYFINNSGQNCFEALKVLKHNKKTETARLLEEAIKLINPKKFSEKEIIEKLKNGEVEELYDEKISFELEKLDAEFYKYPDGSLTEE